MPNKRSRNSEHKGCRDYFAGREDLDRVGRGLSSTSALTDRFIRILKQAEIRIFYASEESKFRHDRDRERFILRSCQLKIRTFYCNTLRTLEEGLKSIKNPIRFGVLGY